MYFSSMAAPDEVAPGFRTGR